MKAGQRITLTFEGREFDVIVIDSNGLGEGQPSVGFGFRMIEKYAGIPESTLRSWVREIEGVNSLELPSGKLLKVRDIFGIDGNLYRTVEASDWFALVVDLLVSPGKTGKGLRAKLGNLLTGLPLRDFMQKLMLLLKAFIQTKIVGLLLVGLRQGS